MNTLNIHRASNCWEDEMVYFGSSVLRSLWSETPTHTLICCKSHQPNADTLSKVFLIKYFRSLSRAKWTVNSLINPPVGERLPWHVYAICLWLYICFSWYFFEVIVIISRNITKKSLKASTLTSVRLHHLLQWSKLKNTLHNCYLSF